MADGDVVIGYTAVLINDNPNMRKLRESGLQVMILLFHRVAISENQLGKGYAKQMMLSIEDYALSKGIYSVKADTNRQWPHEKHIPKARLCILRKGLLQGQSQNGIREGIEKISRLFPQERIQSGRIPINSMK